MRFRTFSAVAALALAVASCGDSGDPTAVLGITEAELTPAEAYFTPIQTEAAAFQELQASGGVGADAIRAFVERAYEPDVVFDDVSFGDHSAGYDEVTRMYGIFMFSFADATVENLPTLVGAPTALQVIRFSDITLGNVEFTASAPLLEFDLTAVGQSRVASLQLFYDLESLRRLQGETVVPDGAVQQAYGDAWTSGDTASVAALYSPDAARHDGLAGRDVVGREAIAEEAGRWFDALPGATWTVRYLFGESHGSRVGAVFEVTFDECAVEVGLVFELDSAGQITGELVHYSPATLRLCGWVA